MTRMGAPALRPDRRTTRLGAAPCTPSARRCVDGRHRRARGRATTRSTSCTSPRRARSGRSARGYGGNALLGEEVLRAAHRLGAWPATRAGSPSTCCIIKVTSPAGPGVPRRRRVPVGVRQDQPRDAAADHPRLEGRDHRRRHRLAAARRRRPPLGDQPGGRLLRRRPRHRRDTNADRRSRRCGATRSSPTSRCATTATSGGRG